LNSGCSKATRSYRSDVFDRMQLVPIPRRSS
jgi:hypothetical protein